MLERYCNGGWHAVTPEEEALLAPHLQLEERFEWIDGVRTNVGGAVRKTKSNRRVRCPNKEHQYLFYLVDLKPWREIF